MMLHIALRAHRTGLIATGAICFVATFVQGSAFAVAAGSTPAEREAFGREVEALAAQLAYLLPLPLHPETFAGYVNWRGYGALTLIVAFWALLSATGAIRNEEERGLLETWLGAGVGRVRLIATRCVAFALVAAFVVAAAGLGTLAAGAANDEPVPLGGLVETSLALHGVAVCCFAIALLAAQLASSRRGAAGLGGGILLALFLLDSLGRVNPSVSGWSRVSPFHLRNATNALSPGGTFDLPATLTLFAVAALMAAVATVAFVRRDLGGSLVRRHAADRPPDFLPSENPLLQLPVLNGLYAARLALIGWILGAVVVAALLVSLASSVGDLLQSNPSFAAYFTSVGSDDPAIVLLAVFWSSMTALLVTIYSVVQVSGWADDDREGRLEMALAQPVPRWRIVVERGVELAVATALIAGGGGLAIAALGPGQGVRVDSGRLTLATVLLVPLALTFGALGAAVIARLPRVAMPALGALAVGGFFIQDAGPLFKWPDWALDFSVFRLYGPPLATGQYTTGLYVMAAVIVAGFGAALLAMRTREVGR
jgi:ABC-2 type transport system permease protein